MNTDLRPLLDALSDLFEQGTEEIATIGAKACREVDGSKVAIKDFELKTHRQICEILDDDNALSIASDIKPVMDRLAWHYSGYEDGRITADVALRMQTVEIIGANGMIDHPSCRVGLFSQTRHTDYIIRSHSAEELFVQIAGQAEWMKGNEPYSNRFPGDRMHHQSYQDHASRTNEFAMIAAWVWAGEIDYSTYKYAGKTTH